MARLGEAILDFITEMLYKMVDLSQGRSLKTMTKRVIAAKDDCQGYFCASTVGAGRTVGCWLLSTRPAHEPTEVLKCKTGPVGLPSVNDSYSKPCPREVFG